MPEQRAPDEHDALIEAIRRLPAVPPAPAARDRLLAAAGALEADGRGRSPWARARARRWWWIAPVAAAALFVVWLRLPGPGNVFAPQGVAAGDAARSLELLSLQTPAPEALTTVRTRLGPGSSDPVRVLAVDALTRVASPEALEAILLETARSDDSPFVQASVLTAGRSLGPEGSARVARALLERDNLDAVLRREAALLDTPLTR